MLRSFSAIALAGFVLVACNVPRASADEPLKIAPFVADVTPPVGSPLCNGYRPPVKQVDIPLTARGIVLLGAGKPIILCAVDWIVISNGGYDKWRESLATAAQTSVDRVVVQSVHQHDAPGCDFTAEEILKPVGLGGKMFDPDFARRAIARTADAARQALKTPESVTHLGMGAAKVEKVASNRRMLGPDGKVKFARMSTERRKEAREAPEGVIDSYLRTLSFWNADEPIACLSYYAVHPTCNYGHGGACAEFAGAARANREKALPGVVQIYFTGASGNVAVGKYNDGAAANRRIFARRMTDAMAAAWKATTRVPIAPPDVEWRVEAVALHPRANLDETKLIARLNDAKRKNQVRIFAARDLAWLRRCKQGRKIDLSCLKLGPAYVLHMPGELFVEYQLAAQKMRPEAMVCLAAYVDVSPGYIGTEIAYSQGGYETGYVSRVAPAVEGVLMKVMHELLRRP
jgi:hypothetical protein